ncbi:GNAT family N-acetyltransferase [Streptococcus sp. zg-86]|uniref:GNAT family N-acetyltransferase n=1 Tax=Streptococcus zhangguiae TaxID=2664091 RepID=A0A6I4RJE5_9STRE|nr:MULTISPECIES: GNAT family N-acetyltransferase [unclassified Streptococcus]MTB64706.1 GNAT family N-acetyltransferase [Streptococcus sp. zg-86]MTB91016.1 GNAT family N-acetyltransferase [Streptococcus sp. zg-36]MWV56561.1 GNAT family N-acetyltransferase [Streptococcus sp. zg-70]QTH48524.1 GNAT family N-acetyltransferase [Streptococcus sp. zg-86]
MTLHAFSLSDLINALGLNDVKTIIKSFKSINVETSTVHDVEVFLHTKAIEFEKSSISSTYLVFDTQTGDLVGFFSLANKPLIFSKKDFQALSKNKQKLFNRHGRKLESGGHQVNSYLIGQLGKNYSLPNNTISGRKILTLAYDKAKEAARIINTRYIWLECDNNPKLLQFYQKFGFVLIENFESESGLRVLVMKIHK